MPTFQYTVDDEPQTTTEHILTPVQILEHAGKAVATHYLVEIVGKQQKSYKDTPQAEIHIHQHQKFVSVYTGATTVS